MNPSLELIPPEIRSFDQLQSMLEEPSPLLLYFSSESCTVCHAMLPKLMARLENFSSTHEKAGYRLALVAADQQPEICGQLLVFTVPTLLLFWQGREVLRESRFIDLNKTIRILSQMEDPDGSMGLRHLLF